MVLVVVTCYTSQWQWWVASFHLLSSSFEFFPIMVFKRMLLPVSYQWCQLICKVRSDRIGELFALNLHWLMCAAFQVLLLKELLERCKDQNFQRLTCWFSVGFLGVAPAVAGTSDPSTVGQVLESGRVGKKVVPMKMHVQLCYISFLESKFCLTSFHALLASVKARPIWSEAVGLY